MAERIEHQLIEAQEDRTSKFLYRLQRGETLRGLRFGLTARGRERLRWYDEQAKGEKGQSPWL